MGLFSKSRHARLMVSAAVGALALGSGAAYAQTKPITIAPQTLASALHDFGAQTGRQIMFTPESAASKMSRGVDGATDEEMALAQLLQGTGLRFRREANVFIIMGDAAPQSESAAGDGADGTVDTLVVTAQKREEDIQDVPIAISAFTQEDLTRSQVAGGPDLMTQVPNMTFTKTNFSSYSIQLRGIGTQAISATTDAAVAVAFNNTPFIRNRFFEQEFYDLQRVEVLRGPQGTLYGRNATAGVVNIISAKPVFSYEARASADVANFNSTRIEGMVNVPLVEDVAALRLAGAWTKRDGYATNEITGNPIDGRDLWSTRLSLRIAPSDAIDVNLIWEHFEEDDDRLRSGKQLCKTDEVTEFTATMPDGEVRVFPITHFQQMYDTGQGGSLFTGLQATFSQGCAPESLYSPDSFGTPNGLSLAYYLPLGSIGLPIALTDPYVSRFQSHDLRVIESTVDPGYRAKSDLAELQLDIDVTEGLTLTSETAYSRDFVFSTQDYNRFNTAPGAWLNSVSLRQDVLTSGPNGGIFCDPQIGCADRLVAVDLSEAKSRHFSQEFRLGSDFDDAFNFSLGVNFLRYDTEDKYYVFINSLSLIAAISNGARLGNTPYFLGDDNHHCLPNGPTPPDYRVIQTVNGCSYLDPNPIGQLNDLGHNYFLSRNPYKLISYAVFGEAYYQLADNLKLTAGLRWTVDKKEAPRIPSWILGGDSVGYPVTDVIEQEWREPTGRLTIDWKPDLSLTDETLFYVSYAHGYKAGGANPPPAGPVMYSPGGPLGAAVVANSITHPRTFEPEFVDAFEVGAKNRLLDGRLTINAAAFYYDYTGYQISQIVNRSAVNLNFDADVWGLEIEADWRPLENLRLGFKGGYEGTRVADGEKAVDLMDRTAGREGWVVVKPFPTFASNCILPAWLYVGADDAPTDLVNLGNPSGGGPAGCELAYVLGLDPVTRQPYMANPPPGTGDVDLRPDYPGWDPKTAPNNGEGFDKELGGNELPNAPNFTATLTADYTIPLPNDWLATLHTDLYYQSEAWTRIFNMDGYDKLKAYTNVNLAAIFTSEEAGWKVMAYVKNVFDRDSITGAFLNSDDSGLTTNVFLTEPRLYGLRVTKEWNGAPWWNGKPHQPGEPYRFTLELGGQAQRQDAPYDPVRPSFSDSFAATLDPALGQNRDLDWGDGREVKLTYAVPGSSWRISGAVRSGEANQGHRFLASEVGDVGCWFGQLATCYVGFLHEGINYSDETVHTREEHQVVDFAVGRDVGLGGLRSRLVAGLRYARLKSRTEFDFTGIGDWDLAADNAYFYNYSHHHRHESEIIASREFKGVGPMLSWEASRRLLGDEGAAHANLDWSLGGGVLFGRQKTSASGEEREYYFDGPFYYNLLFTRQVGDTVATPAAPAPRSKSATVPVLEATMGLSYEVERLKVSAGYRWERYFDVLDVGYDEHQDADRTIDGPYFKLAVGFGG